MAFMGELSDISVVDLLQLLELRKNTGKLTISANNEYVVLFLEEGRLVYVSSSNLALRLGRMLVKSGLLDADQLRQALEDQEFNRSDRSLGQILVDRGWLTEVDLARCVEEQSIHALAQVSTATRGVFVWNSGQTAPRRVESVPLNANRILLEAVRRTDELSTIGNKLPPMTAPLVLCNWIDDAVNSLSDEEVLVTLALQSSAGSLAELMAQLALDEVTLGRIVVSMRERGLILAGNESLPTPTLQPQEIVPFDALEVLGASGLGEQDGYRVSPSPSTTP